MMHSLYSNTLFQLCGTNIITVVAHLNCSPADAVLSYCPRTQSGVGNHHRHRYLVINYLTLGHPASVDRPRVDGLKVNKSTWNGVQTF